MDDKTNDLNRDSAQDDLETQLDQAVSEGGQDNQQENTNNDAKPEETTEGNSPDLGTAKEQMNQEDGIEIL